MADARLDLSLPADRMEGALRGLLDHSLTELVPGDIRCLRTHGVLLDSVARVTPAGERDRLATVAAGLLLRCLPTSPEQDLRDSRLTVLAPHVLALLRRVITWPATAVATVESAATCALHLVTASIAAATTPPPWPRPNRRRISCAGDCTRGRQARLAANSRRALPRSGRSSRPSASGGRRPAQDCRAAGCARRWRSARGPSSRAVIAALGDLDARYWWAGSCMSGCGSPRGARRAGATTRLCRPALCQFRRPVASR
jgi:hypothetical protein